MSVRRCAWSLLITACRVLTWCCVFLLAVLSLLPAHDMVRTGFPGELEHLVAYAGSAAIGMAGYGPSRGGVRVIGGFWVYAAVLEYLQHFSPGRHPAGLRRLGTRSIVWGACRRAALAPPLRSAALSVVSLIR